MRLPTINVALVNRIVLVPSSLMSFATSATVSKRRSSARLTWISFGPALSAACSSAFVLRVTASAGDRALQSCTRRLIVRFAAAM